MNIQKITEYENWIQDIIAVLILVITVLLPFII